MYIFIKLHWERGSRTLVESQGGYDTANLAQITRLQPSSSRLEFLIGSCEKSSATQTPKTSPLLRGFGCNASPSGTNG